MERYVSRFTPASRAPFTPMSPSCVSEGLSPLSRKTASMPRNADRTVLGSSRSPAMPRIPGGSAFAFSGLRVRTETSAFRARSSRTTWEPTVPVPPITRTFIRILLIVRVASTDSRTKDTPGTDAIPRKERMATEPEPPPNAQNPPLAYRDPDFLDSEEGRPVRILAEYLQPLHAFRRQRVHDTIAFFG